MATPQQRLLLQRAAGELAEAEAGVEVVASAGGEAGLFDQRTIEPRRAGSIGRPGAAAGMDHDGADAHVRTDRGGGFADLVVIVGGGMDAQDVGDLAGFFEVQAEDHVGMLRHAGESSHAAAKVLGGAFLGVGQVDEDLAGSLGKIGQNIHQHVMPDVAEHREHRPVVHGDQVGRLAHGGEPLQADTLEQRLPVHLGKAE